MKNQLKIYVFSQSDGRPGVSREHINGVAGDLRYLSQNKNGEVIYLSYPQFDYNRQVKFNNALYKFGWGKTKKMYSENFNRDVGKKFIDEKTKKEIIKKVKEKTLLPHTKHMRKVNKDGKIVYRHDHHLHLVGFDFSSIKIK